MVANMLDERGKHFEFEQLRSTTSLLGSSSSSVANINSTFHHIPLIPSTSSSNSHSPHHQFPLQTQTNLFHPSILSLPHHSPNTTTFNSNSINFQTQTPPPLIIDSSWTNDELLLLFKITSTIHNFFPDQLITWDHVSSNLAEFGIKKSAQNCKEKFEHENTSFMKIHNNHNDNNFPRFVSDLQDLYQGGGVSVDNKQPNPDENKNTQHEEDDSRDDRVETKHCDDDDKVMMEKSKNKKRKRRRDRFEMLKSFCETVVNKIIAQQEEIHNKLLEDMLKRDQEKLAREEAWKKQEIERMNMMVQQQEAIASDRQANIIEFLNKYLATGYSSSSSQLHSQNPNNPSNNLESKTPFSNVIADQNPSSSDTEYSNSTSTLVVPTIMEKLEDRRRWPRDEVLALINLKSTTSVTNRSNNNVEGNSNKGPLWERISEGMFELGYKRSAKRCKEKWENINKYFKKTKDIVVNKKKRSMDSRTCPYFHQLSSLYNQQQQQQGKIIDPQLTKHPTSNSNGHIVDDPPQAQSSDSPMG